MPGLIQFDQLMYAGQIRAGGTVMLVQSIFDGSALPISVVAPFSPPEGMLNLGTVTITIHSPTRRAAVTDATMKKAPTVPGMFFYYHTSLPTDEVGIYKAMVTAIWNTYQMTSPLMDAFEIATWRR